MYGNSTKVTRTVTVKEPPPPKNSTIYLTFDDGPSNVTDDVLNILSEEGVKATFFVINRNDSYNYLMQRAVNEGHTVALHGYSHNYRSVYASLDSYFNDMNLISDKVYNVTGIRSNIFRFVGGSSNTVSNFNPGIMTTLTKEAINRGYKYYDWNVSSNDTSGLSSSQIYNRVISQIGNNSTYIVLMHDYDNNWNTVNIIRDIIRWGKNNGYKFSNITNSTPDIHHTVNN
jgi:peptidoglycan/xylan/chitin deacetylase (PgdA/CDA1 family)